MEVQIAVFLDAIEVETLIRRYMESMSYDVKSIDFELEQQNGSYNIGGCRVIANPKESDK